MLNDDIRNAVSVFEPESEETLLLNDVQLYEIRHPSFAAECPPLPPHIAPALREDDAYVHTLRTDRLYVLQHEETTHRVLFGRIPRCEK